MRVKYTETYYKYILILESKSSNVFFYLVL